MPADPSEKLPSFSYLPWGKGSPGVRYSHVLGPHCFFFIVLASISGPLDQGQKQMASPLGCHPLHFGG